MDELNIQSMFEIIYSIFFVVLVAEVIVFLFLTLPTPRGWKGTVINFLNGNPTVQTIRKAHLGFCVIAAFFLWDSMNSGHKFREIKEHAKAGDSLAAELKSNYYSYLNVKSQRNTYITAMLIYVSLALNVYVWILHYMYEKRSKYQAEQPVGKREQEGTSVEREKAKEGAAK